MTILGGFENPRRGRRSKKVNNKCFENSRSQIVFRTDSFHKLSLGAPERLGTQVCYLSAWLGFDVVTPERVGDIVRSLLVQSFCYNLRRSAKYKEISDAEECRKLAVYFASKVRPE